MNPTPDGPEYLPLPGQTRGETRKTGGVYREAGIPQTVVAMMAIAFSGVGVWFASGRATAPPAPALAATIAPRLAPPALVAPALAAPALAAPAPLTPALPPIVSESPAPFADGVSYAPSPTATDEMPMTATPNSGMVSYGSPVPPQPAMAVAPQAAPKPCPLCDRAQDPQGAIVVNEQMQKQALKTLKASDFKGVQVSIVGSGGGSLRVDLVGPCAEGFLYRLTNTLHHSVGPTVVATAAAAAAVVAAGGTNMSYWTIKALKPGESAEIRSPSSILGITYKSL